MKEEKNRDILVHDVKDATGIVSKYTGIIQKGFDYLYNADYITATQKAELRQQAIEMGLFIHASRPGPQGQGQKEITATTPPSGTYFLGARDMYQDFFPHIKKQEKCFEDEQAEVIVKGYDNYGNLHHKRQLDKDGKPLIKPWPHDKAVSQ